MNSPPLEVKVWGSLACFTRPEFGTERVSYEVMTPSAARGILESVFWKPEFTWQVQEIAVLSPVRRDLNGLPLEAASPGTLFRHTSILRNEVNTVQTLQRARSDEPYYADLDRAQRHTLALRDVAYVVRAEMRLRAHAIADGVHINKYTDQFQRRVKHGRCFHQPYLGTREFTAYFSLPDDEPPVAHLEPVNLGLMLHDLDFTPSESGKLEYLSHDSRGARFTKGAAKPRFFEAILVNGVLKVPQRGEA